MRNDDCENGLKLWNKLHRWWVTKVIPEFAWKLMRIFKLLDCGEFNKNHILFQFTRMVYLPISMSHERAKRMMIFFLINLRPKGEPGCQSTVDNQVPTCRTVHQGVKNQTNLLPILHKFVQIITQYKVKILLILSYTPASEASFDDADENIY